VFPVNPKTDQVEGDSCYASLADVPGPIDGAVIATPPSTTAAVVEQCAELGIPRVWLHRSFGEGSVSPDAVELCHEKGISVIAGACPMMFFEGADVGHRCMRWLLGVMGKLPEPAGADGCGAH
jgi:predicted CoA-binding protein